MKQKGSQRSLAYVWLFLFAGFGFCPAANSQKRATPNVFAKVRRPLQINKIEEARTKPTILFNRGVLTIAARSSTLGEVLSGVRSVTGVSIHFPESANEEFVSTRLGPDTVVNVLAKLLRGIRFNYVIVGNDPYLSDVRVVLSEATATIADVQSADHVPSLKDIDNVTAGHSDIASREANDIPTDRDNTQFEITQPSLEIRGKTAFERAGKQEPSSNAAMPKHGHLQERPRFFPPVKTQ
jgi:hypothetical protein